MGPYIGMEREKLEDTMQKCIQEEQVGQDGALPVYTSSVQMFGILKVREALYSTTVGQTFFDLHKEFKACLSQYGNIPEKVVPISARPPETSRRRFATLWILWRLCRDYSSARRAIKSKIDERHLRNPLIWTKKKNFSWYHCCFD